MTAICLDSAYLSNVLGYGILLLCFEMGYFSARYQDSVQFGNI